MPLPDMVRPVDFTVRLQKPEVIIARNAEGNHAASVLGTAIGAAEFLV